MSDESQVSRRAFLAGSVATTFALAGKSTLAVDSIAQQPGSAPAASAGSAKPGNEGLTKADIDRLMTELSNWGRWGKDDQMGTVNLITPETRRHAASLVREGTAISLAHDQSTVKSLDNIRPLIQITSVTAEGGGDTYTITEHGNYFTHFDALCHQFWNGLTYNGYQGASILTSAGASKLDIDVFKNGVYARGILMDIARLKGVPYMEPETPIYPEDLDAWARKAHIKFESGDVIFLRNGRWARRAAVGSWDQQNHSAGLHVSCVRWLKDHNIAVLASDAISDVRPSKVEGVPTPIHKLVIVGLGTPIIDNCDLEEVSEYANRKQRWDFLVTMAPMRIPGGTGSPINPTALF